MITFLNPAAFIAAPALAVLFPVRQYNPPAFLQVFLHRLGYFSSLSLAFEIFQLKPLWLNLQETEHKKVWRFQVLPEKRGQEMLGFS